MKLSNLGGLHIEVTPSKDPEILSVDIAAENRRDVVSMTTNKDENIDQFCNRLRGMCRALYNAEPRVLPAERLDVKPPAVPSWDQQKAAMTGKAK